MRRFLARYEHALSEYVNSKDTVKSVAKKNHINEYRFGQFLKERGIDRPKKRIKKYPIDQVDWDSIGLGKQPDRIIGLLVGIPRRLVCSERRKRGIKKFGGLYLTQEGESCRSIYEAMYDAWLHDRCIPHEHELKIGGMIADFKIGGVFHEIAGMLNYEKYKIRHNKKKQIYQNLNIPVKWITGEQVLDLFKNCNTPLRFEADRKCEICGKRTMDLVKRVCRGACYTKRWRDTGEMNAKCLTCGNEFHSTSGRKYCSHKCYSATLKTFDDTYFLNLIETSGRSINSIAIKHGIKPSTLYMMYHRARNKKLGLTGDGAVRKR